MTSRAALYLRQSKGDEQGIDRQLERTRSLAELRGWTVAGEYVDNDVSASKARGAGTAWGRMLADADAGLVDVVVAVDLDRLLRSTRDLNTLIDHGLQVVTVNGEIDLSTADGEFRGAMLASIARFEVRRKGERQTRANADRAARGGIPKGVRLTGYTTAGEVVEDEAARIRAMFEQFAAGDTLRTLAHRHESTPSSVRTALTNARYAGRRVYKGEVVGQGAWEPIVSGDLFDLVSRKLSDPTRVANRTGSTARKALGTSLFVCECGSTVRTAGSGGRYWCPSCGLVRTMGPVDDYVLAVLYARLGRQDARHALAPSPDLDPLRVEAEALRGRKSDLAGLLADGTLSPSDVKAAAAKLTARIEDLDRQIAAIVSPALTGITKDELAAGLDALSLDRRRALIDAFMVVTLHRGTRGSRTFDPSSVVITWRS
ncbi:recombinase family protein [Frigoribacterium sp. NPDC087798]|uniref:recombinase family protein n=1 Tax=Frigoribacterium sp. NPDC087798 TaxID=3363993 RepID=UPI00380718B3